RADVGEGDLQRRLGGGRGGCRCGRHDRRLFFLAATHQGRGGGEDAPAGKAEHRALRIGHRVISMKAEVMCKKRANYEPGKKGFPSDAGMLVRIHRALRDMSTSTTMVARYGSAVSSCEDTCTPSPCRWNCSIVTPPNRHAPSRTRAGRQVAKVVSASA